MVMLSNSMDEYILCQVGYFWDDSYGKCSLYDEACTEDIILEAKVTYRVALYSVHQDQC